ncbi:MAG: O-antigen ligase family protein [Candidatus Omnitrophica bacterium]|nr:O-antigen ligase family protein [Candidatus Omnitrophota bacterium]
MNASAFVLKRFFPELDEHIDAFVIFIGVLAFLTLKGVILPQWLIILIVAAALFGVVSDKWQHPELPLYLLCAYLPFSYALSGGSSGRVGGLNIENLLMGLALWVHWRRCRRTGKPFFETSPVGFAIAAMAGMALVSFLAAGAAYGGWYLLDQSRQFLQWMKPFFLYYLTFWIVRDRRCLSTVLSIVLIAVVVVGLLAIWESWDRTGSSFDNSRVRGVANHPNMLAGFFVTYMFVFLGFFLTRPLSRNALMLLPFLLCVRGVMVTFSRGGYLAVAAGALVASWFRSKKLFLVAVVILMALAVHPAWLPAGVRYRMGMTLSKEATVNPPRDFAQNFETSASKRVYIWQAGVAVTRQAPLLGVGFGMFPRFAPHASEGLLGYVDTHNGFLFITSQMGLLTLALFLVLLWAIGWESWRLSRLSKDVNFRALALGVASGLSALMAANLFSTTINTTETTGFFWMLSALVTRAISLERERRNVHGPQSTVHS